MKEETLSNPEASETPSGEQVASDALFALAVDALKALRSMGYRATCADYIDGFEADAEGRTWQQMLIDIDPETMSLHTPEDIAPFDANSQEQARQRR